MTQQNPTEISYSEAIGEIEEILRSLQDGQADIDTLTQKVRRASELIRTCRAKLTAAKKEVEEILKEDNQ